MTVMASVRERGTPATLCGARGRGCRLGICITVCTCVGLLRIMHTDDSQGRDIHPFYFPLRMKPSFRDICTKEQIIGKRLGSILDDDGTDEFSFGTPIRWKLNDDVVMTAVVVDWTDEPDDSITLTIEAKPM